MESAVPPSASPKVWQEFEQFFAQLDECARTAGNPEDYFRQFLELLLPMLAASGGAVWKNETGRWVELAAVNLRRGVPGPQHKTLLQQASRFNEPRVLAGELAKYWFQETDEESVLAVVPLTLCWTDSAEASPFTVMTLALRGGATPTVHRGWEEFLAVACQSAHRFQLRQQLRELQEERRNQTALLPLLAACQSTTDLDRLAAEIVNHGLHVVEADRLSLFLQRGKQWRLTAVSGLERVEPYAEAVTRLESLAAAVANWGEVCDYSESSAASSDDDLPPLLQQALADHVDCSPARRLVAVPVVPRATEEIGTRTPAAPHAVLVAESFATNHAELSRQNLIELAHVCSTPLAQAQTLDRITVRSALRWQRSWDELCARWGLHRASLVAAIALAVVLALVLIPAELEVAVPAELSPQVERNLFAPNNGVIREILVRHGDTVQAGETVLRIESPELELELEQVQGERSTLRKRLEAIRVARTERSQPREDQDPFSLSAEGEQIQLQLASLEKQQQILQHSLAALAIESPLSGVVTTLDAQDLLRNRPVERGQQLLTVSDTASGWKLRALVPQDQIGHVLEAQRNSAEVPVRFRVHGAREKILAGKIVSISQAALVKPEQLTAEMVDVPVEIACDQADLPAAKPGMAADVRIQCGRHSLGYVWFHDAWEYLVSWITF